MHDARNVTVSHVCVVFVVLSTFLHVEISHDVSHSYHKLRTTAAVLLCSFVNQFFSCMVDGIRRQNWRNSSKHAKGLRFYETRCTRLQRRVNLHAEYWVDTQRR